MVQRKDTLFVLFAIILVANCSHIANKIKGRSSLSCPAFTAEEYNLRSGWGCSDSSWNLNQGSTKITFQARGNDWYIGGFNPSGQMVYFIVFIGWNNSATKVLTSNGGVAGNCQAGQSIRSDTMYNYVVTIDGPTGQIRIDIDGGIHESQFNRQNFKSKGDWKTIFHCNAGANVLQQAVTYRLSCYCTRPSDTVVTLYNYKTIPVVPGNPDFTPVPAEPPKKLITPENKCLKPYYQ
jgi:hypothetical protein